KPRQAAAVALQLAAAVGSSRSPSNEARSCEGSPTLCRRDQGCDPRSPWPLGRLQVDRGIAALAILLEIEADLLAFVEASHARALNRGNVHKHILAAAVLRDEAEALGGIEKLYSTDSHLPSPSQNCQRGPSTAGGDFSKRRANIRREREGSERDATRIDALHVGALRPKVQSRCGAWQMRRSRSLLTSSQEIRAKVAAGVVLTTADLRLVHCSPEGQSARASAHQIRGSRER